MEANPYEEDIEDVRLYNERENLFRVAFKDNEVEVDDEKKNLHPKRWGVYMNEK